MFRTLPLLTLSVLLSGPVPAGSVAENSDQQATIGLSADLGAQASRATAYFALVAENSAWDEPLYEELAPSSKTVEWAVPPGRYRFIVGVPGYRVVYGSEVRAASGQSSGKRPLLARLAPLEGRVQTQDGQPIAGAKVGHPPAFITDFAGRLSAMGRDHLAGNFATLSNTEGHFALPALPGFRHLILVEAEGFSPGFLVDIAFDPPSSVGPWEVSLGPGATLELTLSGGPTAPVGRIWLYPAGPHPLRATGIPPPGALWQKRSSSKTLRWPALPPGEYEIWLRDAHGIGSLPQRLGQASLKTGESARLKAVLPTAPKATVAPSETHGDTEPADAPLRILARELRGRTKDGETLQRWREGEWSPLTTRRKAVSGGSLFSLAAACRPGDRFLFTSSKSLGITAPVMSCATDLALDLWPRSDLTGALRLPRGQITSAWSLLRFRPCDPGTEAELFELPVDLSRAGGFATTAPSGCFDLSAHVDDWAPARWTKVLLRSGETRNLDPRTVAPGGALLARVVSAQTGQPQAGVRVGLLSVGELSAAAAAAAASKRFHPLATAVTDNKGWFRLSGLAPGDYLLSLDDGRRWPHFSAAIGIRSGDEYFQPELQLPRPLQIQIEIVGDESFFAEVEELTVNAGRGEESLRSLSLSASVDETRTALFSDVPPGQWRFTVAARLHSGVMQPVLNSSQEVVAGQDAFLRLEVEGGLFHGVVTRHGEPEEGVLRLSTLPAGVQGQRVSTRTNDQGQFQVFLQRGGNYKATFSSLGSRGERTLIPKVLFEDPNTEVEIELPTGRIAGRVVGPQGRGVAGATVRASALGEPEEVGGLQILNQGTRSEEGGSFVISGLPPTTWSITARAEELQSDPLAVELLRDEQIEGLLVELREEEWVEITVVNDQGLPVSDVNVSYSFPLRHFGEEPVGGSGRSNSSGTVRIDARGRAGQTAYFLLITSTGSVSCLRNRLEPATTLVATEQTGRVHVGHELPADAALELSSLALVSESGCALILRKVSQLDRQRGRRTIPRLAAGNWRLVRWRSLQDYFLLLSSQSTLLPTEAQWKLEPGGEVEVMVYTSTFGKE